MRQILIAAAVSMTWASDASALTGAELQTKCRPINMVDGTRNWAQVSDMNQCWSYILGVEDATFIHTFDDRKICVPDGVTYGTRAQVVLAYLDKYPSKLHWQAVYLVNNALVQAKAGASRAKPLLMSVQGPGRVETFFVPQ